MENLYIPPSPNWYEVNILACTPNNDILYGAKNDLIFIPNGNSESSKSVKIIKAHTLKTISVDINPQWGKSKFALTASQDCDVKIFNMETFRCHMMHDNHGKHSKEIMIGARFLTEHKVLSVSEGGTMFMWLISSNECIKMNYIFDGKVSITCFSPCPHASYRVGFGLKSGLIVIADVRKNGKILHKLRGHTSSLISLSWCPAPINIFPSNPNNYIKGTVPTNKNTSFNNSSGTDKETKTDTSQIDELLDELHLEDKIRMENMAAAIIIPKDKIRKASEDFVIPQQPIKPLPIIEDHFKPNESQKDGNASSPSSDQSFEKIEVEKGNSPKLNIDEKMDVTALQQSQIEIEKSLQEALDSSGSPVSSPKSTETHPPSATKGRYSPEYRSCFALRLYLEQQKSGSPSSYKRRYEDVEELKKMAVDTTPGKLDLSDLPPTKSYEETFVELFPEDPAPPILCPQPVKKSEEEKIDKSVKSVTTTPNIKTKSVQSKEEEPREEYLLASIARDCNINIWRAGTDGRNQTFMKATLSPKKGKVKEHTFWSMVLWVSPFTILTSGKQGELISWKLPKPQKENQNQIVHHVYKNFVFNIVAHVPILTKKNWLEDRIVDVWTFGQGQLLVKARLGDKPEMLLTLKTLNGTINCMAESPECVETLAFGSSSGYVHVGQIQDWNKTNIVFKDFRAQGRITSIAWCPTDCDKLAFASDEGRIFLVNTKSEKLFLFKYNFTHKVHKLEWGPSPLSETNVLYAMSENRLVYFDPEHLSKDPEEITMPHNFCGFSFAWKLNRDCLLVTCTSGTANIYSSDLKIVSTFYLYKKMDNITWHPVSSDQDHGWTYWVALSIENNVYVYDLKEFCLGSDAPSLEESLIAKLGHQENVLSIAWCPFSLIKLASSSKDGMVKIWNVLSREVLAIYYGQYVEPISSIKFSPSDENFIICGSDYSNSLAVVNINDYPPFNESDFKGSQINTDKISGKRISEEENASPDLKTKPTKLKKLTNSIVPPLFTQEIAPSMMVSKLRKLLDLKEKKNEGIESQDDSTKYDNIASYDLSDILLQSKGILKSLLNDFENDRKDKEKIENATLLALWRGDLKDNIMEAIQLKKVTPLLLSLAPMISQSLWLEACETYAQQLFDKDDSCPIRAASYLLACNELDKAIDLLCLRNKYKEAYVLVKLRMPESSHYRNFLLSQWAFEARKQGRLEEAAQCWIALGEYEQAVKDLFKKKDLEILNFALELAEKTENKELIESVSARVKEVTNSIKETPADTPLQTRQEVILAEMKKNEDSTCKSSPKKDTLKEDQASIKEKEKQIDDFFDKLLKKHNSREEC